MAPILLVTVVQNCLGDLVPGRLAALGSYVYLLVRRLAVGLEPAAATFLLSFVFDLATLGPVLALAALVRLDAVAGPSRRTCRSAGSSRLGAVFFLAAAVALLELGPITRALSRIVRGSAPPAASRREAAAGSELRGETRRPRRCHGGGPDRPAPSSPSS